MQSAIAHEPFGFRTRSLADPGRATRLPKEPTFKDDFVNKEHSRQTEFLHSMILRCDCEHARELLHRMAHARHEDRVLRRAILIALVIMGMVLCVLGYSIVLAPDFFAVHPRLLVVVQAAGVASLLSVVGFVGYAYWARAVSNTLHEECRRYLMLQWRPHSGVQHHGTPAASNEAHPPHVETKHAATA